MRRLSPGEARAKNCRQAGFNTQRQSLASLKKEPRSRPSSRLEFMRMISSKRRLRQPTRLMLIIVSLAFSLLLVGCPGTPNKPTEVNSAPPAPATKSDFDGDRAFEFVRKQVEFGPRPPGTPELEKTRAYIIDQLRSFGLN